MCSIICLNIILKINTMKKRFFVLTVSLLLFACSKENDAEVNEALSNESNVELDADYNLNAAIDEKYDGEIFKFEDEVDFIKFYNELSNLEEEKFDDFLLLKGDNNSSFYRDLSIEEDILDEGDLSLTNIEQQDDSVLLVSEYLSSIFNYDNHVMIGEDLVHLNEKGVFSIVSSNNEFASNKKGAEVIGYIVGSEPSTNSSRAYNVNRSRSWTKYENNKRAIYKIWNETVYFNSNIVSSSKVFFRVTRQYKSCSFWRCKWKSDSSTAYLYHSMIATFGGSWSNTLPNTPSGSPIVTSSSVYTRQLANYTFCGPCSSLFRVYDITFRCKFSNNNFDQTFSNITYDFNPY